MVALLLFLAGPALAQVATLSNLSPSASNATGPVNVTINGTNLGSTMTVRLTGPVTRDITGSDIVFVSATQVIAVFPLNQIATGVYTVSVINGTGPSSNTLTFQSTTGAPQITTINPTSGANNAARTLDVLGANFTGTTQVQIKGPITRSVAFTIVSSTRLSVTVPAGTTAGVYGIQATSAAGPSNDNVLFTLTNAATTATLGCTDSAGNAKTSFLIAVDRVYVTVTDADQNTDSSSQQTVNVTLTDSITGDLEVLTLAETSNSSGVFRNIVGLSSIRATATQKNGTLETQPGATISVQYRDPIFGDTASGTAIMLISPSSSATQFTNASGGAQFNFDIATDRVYITVTDADRNLNPALAETVTVTVTDPNTSDQEVLTLTETGANTGVFRYSAGLPSTRSFTSVAGNLNLETVDGSNIRADYKDAVTPTDTSFAVATMHHRVPAAIAFTDAVGTAKTLFTVASDLVYVTVTDADMNQNPSLAERVNVTFTVPSTGDTETVELVETGLSTGIFRNQTGVTSQVALAAANGILDVTSNGTVSAAYVDPHDSTDQVAASASFRSASVGSTIRFTDSSGISTKLEYQIGAEGIYVSVTDADQNKNAAVTETVTVTLVDTRTGDTEVATLTETGANTGVFRNTAGIPSVTATAVPGNGTVETASMSTVSANYSDPDDASDSAATFVTMRVAATGSSTFFCDPAGVPKSQFAIAGNDLYVSVQDPDRNTDPTTRQTIVATLRDAATTDQESIALVETGVNTGIFRNTTGFPSVLYDTVNVTTGNGRLEVADGDTVTALYTDPDNPPDTSSSAAIMRYITASTTYFCDATGIRKNTFLIGLEPLFVTVIDRDRGSVTTPPPTVKTLQISLSDPVTLDVKTLTVTEDATAIGTFRNTTGFPTVRGARNTGDPSTLYVAAGSFIQATYSDPTDSTDTSTGTAQVKNGPTAALAFFSDNTGTPLNTIDIATGLYVTVNDDDRNYNASVTEQVTVTLVDGSTGDTETLILRETGVNTGVFRNVAAFPMRVALPVVNAILESADGSILTANYTDPDDGEFVTAFATARRGADPAHNRIARFTNVAGTSVTTYPIGDPGNPVYVTVEEPDANLNAVVADTVTVTVRDLNAAQADTVVVQLTEFDPSTGQVATNTGFFRNQTGILSRLASPPLSNNTLEVLGNDFIGITYVPRGGLSPTVTPQNAQMLIKPGNSSIQFTDSAGNAKTTFRITAEPLFMTVTDSDQNLDPATQETVTVSLVSTITGDVEASVTLTETGPNTGIFRNSTGFPTLLGVAVNNDGTLQTASGAVVTANYTDPNDPADFSVATAQMTADEVPATSLAFRTGMGAGASTTTSYQIYTTGRDQIYVRLADADENTNPLTAQSVVVTLIATGTPVNDTESVTLTETGANTGIFESTRSVTLSVASPVQNNGSIQSYDGGGLCVQYRDPEATSDFLQAWATISVGKLPLTTVYFSDTAGNAKATYVVGVDGVFLTVNDQDLNRNPSVRETVNVTLACPTTGDQLAVILTETGASTGIFRNSTGIRTEIAAAVSDSVLQVASESDITGRFVDPRDATDTATARARMKPSPVASLVKLTDQYGNAKSSYYIGTELLYATVYDADQNRNPLVADTVQVSLSSATTGDALKVTLLETGIATGVFRNTVGVTSQIAPANRTDNIFQTADGDTVRVDYQDASTPTDTSFAQARMYISKTPASISFIKSVGSTTTTAAFVIATDPIYVRVVDTDQLKDPTQVETVRVSLHNQQTGDDETATLTEVNLSGVASPSGVRFETLTGMPSRIDIATSGNGIVEAERDSTLTATYVDPDDSTDRVSTDAILKSAYTSPTIQFTDQAGTHVLNYTIGDPTGVFVTVNDPQANKTASTSVRDTVLTSVYDLNTGDIVALQLFELPDTNGIFNTGLFRNTPNLPSVVGLPPAEITTLLYTEDNATIVASYTKDGLSGGGSYPTTQAYDPTIAKILTSKSGPNGKSCFDCHSDDNEQGQLNLTGFRNLTMGGLRGNPVVAGNAQASLIVQKLEPATVNPYAKPHPEPGAGDPALKVGGVISQDDLNKLKSWINEGAVPPTLPTSLTYDQIQASVFTPSCLNKPNPSMPGCHDATYQAGGIRLTDYSGFADAIRFRNAAVLGNGPGSRMVQVLDDATINHTGRRIDVPTNDPRYLTPAAAQMLSEYISQQYGTPPLARRQPLREYTPDVQPYFDRTCTASTCHNRHDLAGGLDLTRYQGLVSGGTSGTVVNPGDVPPSLLKKKLDPTVYPAHTAHIAASFFTSQGPIAITSWINQGAFPGRPGELPVPPLASVTDTAVMKVGPTEATIAFTDAVGGAVTFYKIVDDGIYVTVTDSDRNRGATTSEVIVVDLADNRTGDTERVTLTALHAGSGVFRNRTAVHSVVGTKIPYDGIVQTLNGSTLTATYTDTLFPETKSTTITMSTNTRSAIRFVDSMGLAIGIVPIGVPATVEVVDNDQSGKGRLDAGAVTINVTTTGDLERLSIVMTEITTRPGTFHSQQLITTNQLTSTTENGRLELVHNAPLAATYVDPAFTTDTATVTAIAKVAPVDSQMTFTDSSGVTKTNFVVRVEDLYVTLRDANRNLSPTTTDTVLVTLRCPQSADYETIVLSEIGKDSGVFRNRGGLPTAVAATPAANNGTLEVIDDGSIAVTIRADYSDELAPPDDRSAFASVQIECPSGLLFTDASGRVVTRYTRGTDLIYVTLTDYDRNKDRNVAETVNVTITDTSMSPGDHETLTLVETGKSTGVFRNTTGLKSVFGYPVAIPENRILETRVNSVANPGQVIYGQYVDPVHTSDVANATAEMVPKNTADSDDDGMPDTWENTYGLNPLDPSDAPLDLDVDGWTNLEEYLEGTDPRNPWDHKPMAVAGSGRSVEPGLVRLDGSASKDPRSLPLTYKWTQVNAGQTGHGPAVTLTGANTPNPTFSAYGGKTALGADLSLYEFDLVVTNQRVSSTPNRVAITVINVPPTPFAGIDQQVNVGESITLNGKESADANNETAYLTYAWSRPVGSGGFNAWSPSPIVVPAMVGTYAFDLTCTDPARNTGTRRVYVLAHGAGNHVPIASVPSLIKTDVGKTISIDGSASADADPDDTLTYHWRVTKKPAGVGTLTPIPTDSALSKTNLVPPRLGYYEVELTVTDQAGNRSPPVTSPVLVDFLGSTTQAPNRMPIANAGGNLSGLVGATITLNGKSSRDPDGLALTYRWTQVRGLKTALSDYTSATPSFIPMVTGVYAFDLVVSDGTVESAPSRVFVSVNGTSQHLPVANAGVDLRGTIDTGGAVSVVMDGSASSDSDGDRLTYYWRQVSGPGVALTNREASRPTLTTRQPGTYVFDLTVFDQKNFSMPSRTTIQVNPYGVGVPVANAGAPQTINYNGSSVTVQLDGRASSDPQGLPLAYTWTQISGAPATLSPGPDSSAPTFVVDAVGTYKFSLTVRNSRLVASLPSIAIVTVVDGGTVPPTVLVNGSGGASASVMSQGGVPVTLDASASTGSGGGTLTFIWQQVSGPPVVLQDASTARPSFTPSAAGTYVFSVTVIDSRSNQGTGTVTVFVGTDSPGVVSGSTGETAASGSGGGGGGGCQASRGGPADRTGLVWVLGLWIALASLRRRKA